MRVLALFIPMIILLAIIITAILMSGRSQKQRGGNGSVQIQAGGNIGTARGTKKLDEPVRKELEALREPDLDWLGKHVDLYREKDQ